MNGGLRASSKKYYADSGKILSERSVRKEQGQEQEQEH
jgi:hypothetical protein